MAENGQYVDGSIWFYAPNKVAPVFFAAGFAASGLYHAYQCIHHKSWTLTGLYVFTAMLFTAGFITREIAAFDYQNLVKYIVAVVLVYAAPPVFELGNYRALGRMLYYVPYYSPIHPGRVLTTFALLSALVETCNGRGASLVANSSLPQSLQDQGAAFLKAALVMQLGVVGAFLFLAGTFHHRCAKAGVLNANLRNALVTLYASSALLTGRTIYRVVEYFSIDNLNVHDPNLNPNTLSPLLRYEWFFYVFEATLMLLNTWLLNVRHPRRYLPENTKIYLGRDGVTEIEGPGYKDARPFLITLFDPLDIVGMITGKSKKNRFWDNEEGIRRGPAEGAMKGEASDQSREAGLATSGA